MKTVLLAALILTSSQTFAQTPAPQPALPPSAPIVEMPAPPQPDSQGHGGHVSSQPFHLVFVQHQDHTKPCDTKTQPADNPCEAIQALQ